MRKEILHERALIKVNRRDFRERKAKLLCYTSSIANQIGGSNRSPYCKKKSSIH